MDLKSSVGKYVAGDLYVHKEALTEIDKEYYKAMIEALKVVKGEMFNWNVLRISQDNTAFLNYIDFEKETFPALLFSTRIDHLDGSVSRRDFSTYSNPPILHRKELLLSSTNPLREKFCRLTSQLDELGVFYDAHKIGFRRQWDERLHLHGIEIKDHVVVKNKEINTATVHRHKTALSRYALSQPVQLLLRFGLLDEGDSFFDYGCGRGDDVSSLGASGFEAKGWDPHYASENTLHSAKVVNLGFVLNVIEAIPERIKALKSAWKLAEGVLAVSVMTPSSASITNAKPFSDGFLTTIGTFQKYFTQEQLKFFIKEQINEDPIAAAPGIFLIFRDELLKQEYLIRRYERRAVVGVNVKGTRQRSEGKVHVNKLDRALPILQHLAQEFLRAGRVLHPDEIPSEIVLSLKSENISIKVASHYCLDELCDKDVLTRTSQARKDDLLLYFALEIFNGRRPYRTLPLKLQQDLKYLWGNYENAQIEARQLLFSIGNSSLILDLAKQSASFGLGTLIDGEQLQFQRNILDQLPLALRCYVACASILYGDLESADLIKIHGSTGKLSLNVYEDFSSPLPILSNRVKVDMKSQRVQIFDYVEQPKQYLYLKSHYLSRDYEDFERQKVFDEILLKNLKEELSGYGPPADQLSALLTSVGLDLSALIDNYFKNI